MKRVWCKDCESYEFWQAAEQQPLIHRPIRDGGLWLLAGIVVLFYGAAAVGFLLVMQ
jgi:hypothetical protein